MTKSRKNPKMYQKCQKYQGQSNKHARRRPFSAVRASLALAVDGFASSRGALQDPHQEGARNMKNPADWEKHKARLGATTAAQNNHRTTARPSHSVHANALSLGFLPFGSAHLSASPPAGAVARKYRKECKSAFFWCFRGVEIDLFARNDHASSNFCDLKAGPNQIDPRGSSGSKNSAIPS